MDNIKNVSSAIDDAIKVFSAYYELLDRTGFSGNNPQLADFISLGLHNNTDIIECTSVVDIIKVYYGVVSTIDNLFKINKIFKDHRITHAKVGTTSSNITITTGFLFNSEKLRRAAKHTLQVLYKKFLDADLESELISVLPLRDPETDLKEFVQEYLKHKNNQLLTRLCVRFLQRVRPLVDNRVFVTVLENLKIAALHTSPNKLENNRKTNTIQKLVQTHNLIPATSALSISDLLNLLGVTTSIIPSKSEVAPITPNKSAVMPAKSCSSRSIKNTLEQAAKLLSTTNTRIGFIVIYKILADPVEHDIRALINENYARKNGLLQPSKYGINSIAIARAQTTKKLPSVKPLKSSKVVFIDSLHATGCKNMYYVLETLNKKLFRIVTPNHDLYVEPEFGNIRDTKHNPSTRSKAYNRVIRKAVLKKISEPFVLHVSTDVKLEESHWKGIRMKVKNAILGAYKTELAKRKKLGAAGFTTLLTSKPIVSSIVDLVVSEAEASVKIKAPNGIRENKVFMNEIRVSYYAESVNFAKKIRNVILDSYTENYKQSIAPLLTELTPVIRSRLLEKISDILDLSLKIFINRKESIFITIKNKLDILNKTINANSRK